MGYHEIIENLPALSGTRFFGKANVPQCADAAVIPNKHRTDLGILLFQNARGLRFTRDKQRRGQRIGRQSVVRNHRHRGQPAARGIARFGV